MLAFHFTSLASTNTTAKTLALRHPGQVLLVSSRTQTAGRGRLGRPWISPPGGAWFTVAWPVAEGTLATNYDAVPLVIGQAVLTAVEELLRARGPGIPAKLEIKWPNDLLLNGGKLAGILCERVMTSAADGSQSERPAGNGSVLLIGVGVNVNINPEELGELRFPPASLLQVLGSRMPVGEVIANCARRMIAALRNLEANGFTAQDARQIETLLAFRGRELTFQQGNRAIEGLCLGLNETGALLLKVGDRAEAFSAGEIAGLSVCEGPISGVAF